MLQICIGSICLVSATPPTVLGQSFWNFTGTLQLSFDFTWEICHLLDITAVAGHLAWLAVLFVYVLGATSLWEFNMEVAHKPKMLERTAIRPSVMIWFFFNILKRQWWKFIKFCRHIDIDKMYVYNRQLRARGQFCGVIALCNSYCCLGSVYTGNSTYSTAFTETSWYFVYTV